MKVRVLSVPCLAAILLFTPRPSAAQWVNLGGPGGCNIQALAANGSYLYAGTAFGVFVSTDEGGTWNMAGEVGASALGDASVHRLITRGSDLFVLTRRGVFLSTDNGGSWTPLNSGLPEHPDVFCLIQEGSFLYCGLAEGGIYRSADRGAHWMPAGGGLPEDVAVSNLAALGDVLYAGLVYKEGIYRSIDGGSTWAPMEPPLPEDEWGLEMVIDGRRLFVLTLLHGIFAIQEGGEAWTRIGTEWGAADRTEFLGQSGRALLVGNEDGRARLSTDGGTTWMNIVIGESPDDLGISGFAAIGSRLFVATDDRGLLRSDDLGLTWTAVNAGFPSQAGIVSLARMGTDLYIVTRNWGEGSGIYLRAEGGAGWEPIGSEFPEKAAVHCLATVGTNLVAGTDCGLFLSEDRGRSWSSVGPARAKSSEAQYFTYVGENVYPREPALDVSFVEVAKTRVFAGTAGGLFMSADRGRTWSKVLPKATGSAWVHCFAQVGAALFAAGPTGLYISRDSGETWGPVTTGLPENIHLVSLAADGKILVAGVYPKESKPAPDKDPEITADAIEPDEVLIVPYPEYTILFSEDEGRSWKAGAEGLPEQFRVAQIAASGSVFFAALTNTYLKIGLCGLGFFLSSDGGKSWTEEWPGQWLATAINDILVDKDAIYIATDGAGVWRLPFSDAAKAEVRRFP